MESPFFHLVSFMLLGQSLQQTQESSQHVCTCSIMQNDDVFLKLLKYIMIFMAAYLDACMFLLFSVKTSTLLTVFKSAI